MLGLDYVVIVMTKKKHFLGYETTLFYDFFLCDYIEKLMHSHTGSELL